MFARCLFVVLCGCQTITQRLTLEVTTISETGFGCYAFGMCIMSQAGGERRRCAVLASSGRTSTKTRQCLGCRSLRSPDKRQARSIRHLGHRNVPVPDKAAFKPRMVRSVICESRMNAALVLGKSKHHIWASTCSYHAKRWR